MHNRHQVLGLITAILCIGAFLAIGGLRASLLIAATALVLGLPGVLIGNRLFGPISWKRPEGFILGCAFGLVSSEFVTLMTAYIFGWRIGTLAAALLIFCLLSAALTRWSFKPSLAINSPEWRTADYAVLSAALLIFLLFAVLPFLNFGRLTGSGYAYSWLFGFDFILRGSYVASLSLGMPPDFLHLSGNTFRYYLVSYAGPAFAYSLGAKQSSLMSLLQLYTLFVDLLFIVCLFTVLRHFIRNHRALRWTVFVGMAAYSYYGWYALAHALLSALPQSWLNRIAAGSDTPTLCCGDVSHLFQRLMLVEPQAITGLCLTLGIIYVLENLDYRLTRYDLGVLLGIGLGIGFGVDALLGLIAAIWFGTVYLVRWARDRRSLAFELGPVALATLLCSLIYLSYFGVGMYRFADSGQMHLETYWWVLRYALVYFPIEFGPMLILAVWGLRRVRKKPHPQFSLALVIFAVVVLAQVIFLRVGVLPRERLAQRLLPIMLLVWTGFLFEDLFARRQSRWLRLGVAALILAALPTYFTDIYFSSAIHDPDRTSYITPADMRACEWIRQHLPESAVVQSEPNYYGKFGAMENTAYPISLIPDFAERREIIGEWYVAGTTIVNSKAAEMERARDVRAMFSAREAQGVSRIAAKYAIDYLYIGPCEQNKYPQILGLLQGDPRLFQEIYSQQGVHIFRVLGQHGSSGASVSTANSTVDSR